MNDTDLHDVFTRVLADEPELALSASDVQGAIHKAHRTRTLRRSALFSATAMVAAIAVAIPLVSRSSSSPPVVPFGAASQVINTSAEPSAAAGEQGPILDAITSVSPAGWSFDFHPLTGGFDNAVDGTVDDGAGPGRLMVAVTTHRGYQLVHPCADSEFKSGVGCTESTLADGSVLSVRDLVDYKGIKTLDVVLTHPDGTGTMVEAGNFTIPDRTGEELAARKAAGQPMVDVSRPMPTYSTDQLVAMVKAVDAAAK